MIVSKLIILPATARKRTTIGTKILAIVADAYHRQ